MKHTEITCPYCRIGFGGIKVITEKKKEKWFASSATKRNNAANAKTTFQHLDLFWSYESGLIRDCKQPELLKANLVSVDDRGNPVFNEEFTNKLKELKEDFLNDPIDVSNKNFDYNDYYIAFVECMNYGYLDGDDEEYDRTNMTGEKLKELYDKGINIKDALKSFLKKVEAEN